MATSPLSIVSYTWKLQKITWLSQWGYRELFLQSTSLLPHITLTYSDYASRMDFLLHVRVPVLPATNFILPLNLWTLWNNWAFNFTKPDNTDNYQALRKPVCSHSATFHTKLLMRGFVEVFPFLDSNKFVAFYMVFYSENFRCKSSFISKTLTLCCATSITIFYGFCFVSWVCFLGFF